ncbi:substrate-binding domain-containing protein [Streptomyces mirabilis]
MKVTRTTAAAAAGLALALAVSGCGRGNDGSDAGGGKAVKSAAVLKTLSNPYWVALRDGVKAGADKTSGSAKIQAAENETNIDQQTTLLNTLAGGDYDCYAVAPITGTNLNQPLSQVSAAKKTVVNLDSPIDAGAAASAGVKIATFIASNNAAAGQLAGEHMAKLLGGRGQVAVIGGLSGDANSNARTEGFTKAARAGGLTVVQTVAADWDREKALNATEDILRAHKTLKGVYAANDGMALGSQQAVDNAQLTDVKVIGTDGTEDAMKSVQAGGLAATVAQYPYAIGLMGMEACQAAAEGAKLPKQVDAPLTLITKDNSAAAIEAYPRPFKAYDDPFAALLKK